MDEHFKLILECDQDTNINMLIYTYIPVTKMVNLAFPVQAVTQTELVTLGFTTEAEKSADCSFADRRLKAEGARRAPSAFTSQRKASLPPPDTHSLSSEA